MNSANGDTRESIINTQTENIISYLPKQMFLCLSGNKYIQNDQPELN
jgi:hypothetical protein